MVTQGRVRNRGNYKSILRFNRITVFLGNVFNPEWPLKLNSVHVHDSPICLNSIIQCHSTLPVACVRGCPHPQQHSLPFPVNGKTLLLPPIELIRRRRRTLSAGGLYQMGFINGNGLVSPATAINPRSLITVNCDSVGSGFSCLLLLLSVVGSSFVSQIHPFRL